MGRHVRADDDRQVLAMNGNAKPLALILSICMTAGGIVWAASSLSSRADVNARDIAHLADEHRQTTDQLSRIREDLAGIKAELRRNTLVLEQVRDEVNK